MFTRRGAFLRLRDGGKLQILKFREFWIFARLKLGICKSAESRKIKVRKIAYKFNAIPPFGKFLISCAKKSRDF